MYIAYYSDAYIILIIYNARAYRSRVVCVAFLKYSYGHGRNINHNIHTGARTCE